MTTPTDTKYIVRDPDVLGGKPTIAGHRIAVHHIAWWYSQNESAEQIARDFHLAPAEVHAALVYYYDHKDEIDRELLEEDAEHRARAEADTLPIMQCMRAAIEERKRRAVNG